jgi:hypothetical protein
MNNVELLVWDDLGRAELRNGPETIRTVLNHRYQKQTILSTNWPFGRDGPGCAGAGRFELSGRSAALLGITEMRSWTSMARTPALNTQARLDFEQAGNQADHLVVPLGRLRCPKCSSKKLDERGTSKLKTSKDGAYVDVACSCRDCSAEFIARFYPQKASFELVQS